MTLSQCLRGESTEFRPECCWDLCQREFETRCGLFDGVRCGGPQLHRYPQRPKPDERAHQAILQFVLHDQFTNSRRAGPNTFARRWSVGFRVSHRKFETVPHFRWTRPTRLGQKRENPASPEWMNEVSS